MTGSPPLNRFWALSVPIAVLAIGAIPVSAQSVVVDEGVFTVFLNDVEVGTETFAIRRMGGGDDATLLANGVVVLRSGSVQMRPILETRLDGAPLKYENPIVGEEISRIEVQLDGPQFVATIVSDDGMRERELRARPGTVFLDPNVAHQFHFLAARTRQEGAVVPVVVPRSGRQHQLQVVSIGTESFPWGREQLTARRVRLSSGASTLDVWFDDLDRVLQVDVPEYAYRAVRQPL